ncbi:MAG: flagellar export protein FliJ [Oscillospiraceae bacterium]|nr:flagellar export protein FliJ [Oscillospiraceae bacterium]
MKRFQFQLEPVLNFKQQGLDALMIELSAIQASVAAQENKRSAAYQLLADYDAESVRKNAEGMSVIEALERQSCQQVLARRARNEDDELARLRREAEKKRDEIVEARKETHSLERLREVRQSEFNAALAKAEEKELDDLTAARRASAATAAG